MTPLHLSSIHIYPIKATQGIARAEAVVETRGLQHDRRWMLVDEGGTFLTQREHPRLALVRTAVEPVSLRVNAPGMEPLAVARPGAEAPRLRVRVWKNTLTAAEADGTAHAWFSAYLGFHCRLVYMDDAAVRRVDQRYTVADGLVSFADGYPLLLTSEASLADLNARLDDPVPMNRFRANLVVSGAPAFAEDQWSQVRIGAVLFHVVKPCARCVVTTINQETAGRGKEPLRTLRTFRRHGRKVHFGENLIPAMRGVIRVGDPLVVVARRGEGVPAVFPGNE